MSATATPRSFAAIILAAGQGKRMNSDLPKVLHPVCGKPMIDWVIQSARSAGASKIVVIVGHGRDQVIKILPPGVEHAIQDSQLGTGHAARCAEAALKDFKGPIAVLSGDAPLLRPDTIRTLIAKQAETNASAVVLTGKVQGETAYGRIVRDEKGLVKGIVEFRDATPEQKKIDEINSGTYIFAQGKLFPALAELKNSNAQSEYYLTDTIAAFVQSGQPVAAVLAKGVQEIIGVNTVEELNHAEAAMSARQNSLSSQFLIRDHEITSELAKNVRVFTGNANPKLAKDICMHLGIPLGKAEVGHFPDGETRVQIQEDVRGRDVFIVQSTCAPVNDHLVELLVLIDAVKRASANRITAVIPYYGYARQDRKHDGRVPITAKLVANLITTAGADRVMCVDLHAEQIQGFFDLPLDHLYSMPVQMNYMKKLDMSDLTILSPDLGRTKLTEKFANRLNARLAVIEKRRIGDSEVVKGHVVGEIAGRNALIIDDMISTAGSVSVAVSTAREYGAKSVTVMATHPVFCGRAYERLNGMPIRELIVCDTIEVKKKPDNINLNVLSVAPLLADAIMRIHLNKSVSIMFAE
ncbi:MAG: ribose-phosphate diphosphokinase [Planctomycetota bacterium]